MRCDLWVACAVGGSPPIHQPPTREPPTTLFVSAPGAAPQLCSRSDSLDSLNRTLLQDNSLTLLFTRMHAYLQDTKNAKA
ncbi:hypothetical protein J6590_014433 [Homalodisca vitripennis]|nr:hypothetical protein J6590_014433 [Homalodisca vitripennis]